MINEPHYIVTVNGINVGIFNSIVEADNAGVQACNNGVAGYAHGTRVIEVRDSKLNYQLLGRRTL